MPGEVNKLYAPHTLAADETGYDYVIEKLIELRDDFYYEYLWIW